MVIQELHKPIIYCCRLHSAQWHVLKMGIINNMQLCEYNTIFYIYMSMQNNLMGCRNMNRSFYALFVTPGYNTPAWSLWKAI